MSTINCTSWTKDLIRFNSISWIVPNFMTLLETNREDTRELGISISKDQNQDTLDTKFQLKIQFFGSANDIFEIYYLSSNPAYLKSILTISAKSYGKRPIVNKEYHPVQANKWQYLATFFKKDITACVDKFLYGDGSLRLEVQFMVSTATNVGPSTTATVPEAQLNKDFENLLNNGVYSDVIMKSVDGNEFKVHKAVLACRSAVLKAHFEHKTTVFYTNVVESYLDTKILREVLTFIYSDEAPRVDEIPEELLAAADFYQLSKLKRFCEEALHQKLTFENAINTLQLADLHSAKRLKQLTLEFIKNGQAKLVTKTEGWSKIKSVELIKDMYECIMADDVKADI